MRKAQAMLEVTLIFIVGLYLFFGIMGMWLWGDKQLAQRQPAYNSTRVQAGTIEPGEDSKKPLVWPVYTPEELSANDVFAIQN